MTDGTIVTSAVRELPLEPGGTVDIVLSTGDLRVRGVDGDRVVVRTRDGRPLGEEVRFSAEAGIVRVREGEAAFRIGPLNIRTRGVPDLDIDLPRTAKVSLKTLSGDVEALAIGGSSRWASASGDLRISTSAGPVLVETMSGDAILEASAAIALTARTVSGDLRVRATRIDSLDAATTSGDIRLEASLGAGAPHSVSSVSGDVEIATSSPVRLEAETIAGDVRASGPHRADGGRGRRILTIGNGSVALSVRTTSGDIRLRVQGAAGAPIPMPAPATPAPAPTPVTPARPATPVTPARPATPEPEPRPIDDDDTQAWNAADSPTDHREAARLDVLRALERGDVDVETASRRLEALDQAGPRFLRGWC